MSNTKTAMKIIPRNDYVLIKVDKKEEKTRSGILLPDRAQDERQEATVLAIGPGGFTSTGTRIPIDLNVNDRVLIHQFAGQEVGPKEDRLFLVRQDSIICTI